MPHILSISSFSPCTFGGVSHLDPRTSTPYSADVPVHYASHLVMPLHAAPDLPEVTKINLESVCNYAKTMSDSVAFSGPLPNLASDEMFSRMSSLRR
ncbi:hypothetical protein D4764_04G0010580 [Takifugu flavidus]|uniref:Uncharacterized protein n=1 Tax=Takifugu flavidus TaxID=433684 RepID=A0A5C6N800_9TELE|nr:hypothetical protein D4764_04G0010580 [Takifugu flavidus]